MCRGPLAYGQATAVRMGEVMVFILLVRVGPPEPATHQPFPTRHPSERRDLNRMHTTVATEIRGQARDDRLPRRTGPRPRRTPGSQRLCGALSAPEHGHSEPVNGALTTGDGRPSSRCFRGGDYVPTMNRCPPSSSCWR